MWENPKILLNKKPNYKKLSEYGFIKTKSGYVFYKDIMENTFTAEVFVSENGSRLKVTDKLSGEEYIPVYLESATGAFVSAVRVECEGLIEDIANFCFDENIFTEKNAKLVTEYIEEKYGVKIEYPWEDSNGAVFREPKTGKWFGIFIHVDYKKLGIDKGGIAEIINLKETPENVEKLIANGKFLPAYHMNKKHWYTVLLDGNVPAEEIYRCIDRSFELIERKGK